MHDPLADAPSGVGRLVGEAPPRYRRDGLAGLARPSRRDAGQRKLPSESVELTGGLGLRRQRPSAAAIHRWVAPAARARNRPVPSTRTVRAILVRLDPGMVTLAQEGPAAFRDRLEPLHRHWAEAPNATWQADHRLLDVLILGEASRPARPWHTTVIDYYSRRRGPHGVPGGALDPEPLAGAAARAI